MVAEEILAVGTMGLFLATLALAWFTWTLARATRQLVAIEADREKGEKRRRRIARLERRVAVAENLIVVRSSETFPPALRKLSLPRPEADFVRELATTLDEEAPASVTSDVQNLLQVFDKVLDPTTPSPDEVTIELVMQAYVRLQDWAGKKLHGLAGGGDRPEEAGRLRVGPAGRAIGPTRRRRTAFPAFTYTTCTAKA